MKRTRNKTDESELSCNLFPAPWTLYGTVALSLAWDQTLLYSILALINITLIKFTTLCGFVYIPHSSPCDFPLLVVIFIVYTCPNNNLLSIEFIPSWSKCWVTSKIKLGWSSIAKQIYFCKRNCPLHKITQSSMFISQGYWPFAEWARESLIKHTFLYPLLYLKKYSNAPISLSKI